MKHLKTRTTVSAFTLACLLAGTAYGFGGPHGPHDGPGCGPDGDCHGGPHGPGHRVVADLIDPCGAACRAEARICHETADTQVKTCAQSNCGGEITAAQSACPSGTRPHDSTACRSAVDAVVACMRPCFENEHTTFDACRTTADTCRSTCEANTSSAH